MNLKQLEYNGMKFDVIIENKRDGVWATTNVNGLEIKKRGENETDALQHLKVALYQNLGFKL
ncbi:MAG: hypothetical protein U0O22_05500 [Acutalibacteraceae bacterium]